MELFSKFKYVYPPRPETVIPPTSITELCEGKYWSQIKMNGSCCEIYTFGEGENKIHRYFGRHQNENIANFKLTDKDFDVLKCNNNNWNLIVGEYLNKNKDGIGNHKFIIFDILIFNGEYLINSTLEERIKILDNIFGTESENEYLYKVTDIIYRVKTFKNDLKVVWDKMMKEYPTDKSVYEGLVFKKPNAKLERGLTEKNNMLWHLKCRRPTKNYKY